MPTLKHLAASLRNRYRVRPAHVRTGAPIIHPGQGFMDPRNFQAPTGGAFYGPAAAAVPDAKLLPIMLQQHQDCGGFAWENALFAAINVDVSARYIYLFSRIAAGTYPADTGTFNYLNARICGTKGSPAVALWPDAGDINAMPPDAVNAAALLNAITYYAAPTTDQIKYAIAQGSLPILHFNITTDWYAPTLCADGSYEVITPTALSKVVGGHFAALDRYDTTHKMLDGTVGGYRVRNQWGASWGQAGVAWISEAGWVAKNGDPGSRFVVNAKAAPPVPAPSPAPIPVATAKSIKSVVINYTDSTTETRP